MLADNALYSVKKKFENNKNYQWIIGLSENIGTKYFLNKLVSNYKRTLFLN